MRPTRIIGRRHTLLRAGPIISATAALLLALPVAASAQLGAGVARPTKLEPTSTSAMAVTEFNAGQSDLINSQAGRAVIHLRRAIDADPNLGIARAYYAFSAPGLTAAQRAAELDRAVADAAKGSPAELLIASATRARFQGDFTTAQALFRSAAALVPNDPNVAYQLAMSTSQVPGNRFTESIAPLRNLTTRFPDYAPAYNILAYSLFRSGDRVGSLEMVKQYVAKMPNEANPHDSYAEILAWNGRFDEALVEYKRAVSIDAEYLVGYLGQAEVYTLIGKPDMAKAAITEALPHITVPSTRFSYLRSIGGAYFVNGDLKNAQAQLMIVADEAKTANMPAVVTNAHIGMAMTDAVLGDGKAIAAHLNGIGTEASAVDRAYYSGLAYAVAKQNVQARSFLEELKRARSGNETEATSRWVPILSALILVNEGKGQEALTEISTTDLSTPMTRAVYALAQQAAGNVATARSVRDEITADRAINLDNGGLLTARRLVKRIN